MKKILLTLVIFLLSSSAYAGLYGRLEGGKDINTKNIFLTQVTIGYKLSIFGITSRTFGGWMTFQENNNPFSETYTIGQSLHYKGFFAEVNHCCNHRVVSNTHEDNEKLHRLYGTTPQAMTTVKIGYEWEIK